MCRSVQHIAAVSAANRAYQPGIPHGNQDLLNVGERDVLFLCNFFSADGGVIAPVGGNLCKNAQTVTRLG